MELELFCFIGLMPTVLAFSVARDSVDEGKICFTSVDEAEDLQHKSKQACMRTRRSLKHSFKSDSGPGSAMAESSQVAWSNKIVGEPSHMIWVRVL